MPSEKQFNLWPDWDSEDLDKRTGIGKPASENEAEEKYQPNAEEILRRMREAPDQEPEEVARKRREYAEKVYPDSTNGPTEQEDIARIVANIRRLSAEEIKENERNEDVAGAAATEDSAIDNERDDPWREINPPSMFSYKKKRK